MVKQVFSKQTIIAGVILGIVLCLVTLVFQLVIFPNITIENEARIRVEITPIPDELKTRSAESSAAATEMPTETPVIPGVFAQNMTIVITGTEGEGLNVRQSPGTDSPVVYLAQEGETYTISAGPEIEDGLIWWLISQTPSGEKTGWAVQDYFAPAGG